jgi:hypothetical protein
VDGLRGLPLRLSGGIMRQLARESTRVKALILCRDNVARFFDKYKEHETGIADIVRAQWAEESLPVTTIKPADDYEPGAEDPEPMASDVKGHTLGSVPALSIGRKLISGDPDTDVTRSAAKTTANEAALAADLVQHTHVVRGMADSEQQYNTQLAAYVLSSSCANSGLVIRAVPTKGAHVQDLRSARSSACASECRRPCRWRSGGATAATRRDRSTVRGRSGCARPTQRITARARRLRRHRCTASSAGGAGDASSTDMTKCVTRSRGR